MRFKGMLTALCFIGMIIFCAVRAEAADKTGSIEIMITKAGEPVPGGSLSLFCVALWDGEVHRMTEDFQNFEITDGDWNTNSARKAEHLCEYAQKHEIERMVKDISPEGSVYFSDLREGIYLVVQESPAKGFLPICPFLVEIPTIIGGRSSYDIAAYPKVTEIPRGESAKTGDWGPPIFLFIASGWVAVWILYRLLREKDMQE